MRSWWAIRDMPNVHVVHYAALKADMPCEIAQIADFLDLEVDPEAWPTIFKHCSFDYMKANAAASVPAGGAFWEGGAQTFVHKGTNGRWRDVLTAEQSAAYEQKALAELGPDCAAWLGSGVR